MADCKYILPTGESLNEKEFKSYLLSGGYDSYVSDGSLQENLIFNTEEGTVTSSGQTGSNIPEVDNTTDPQGAVNALQASYDREVGNGVDVDSPEMVNLKKQIDQLRSSYKKSNTDKNNDAGAVNNADSKKASPSKSKKPSISRNNKEIEDKRNKELEPLLKELEGLKKRASAREDSGGRSQKGKIIKPEEAKKILNYLSKKYGIKGVLEDLSSEKLYGAFYQASRIIEISNKTNLDEEGNITSAVTDNINRRTIFHEYLHPFIALLHLNNNTLFEEIYNQAVAENKKNPFANLKNYHEIYQKEELVVRYMDKLSDNDNRPNLLSRFWEWLSDFFYKKRKLDRSDLKKLSPNTTVNELYNVFKNYGNLKDGLDEEFRYSIVDTINSIKGKIKELESSGREADEEGNSIDKLKEMLEAYQEELDLYDGIYRSIQEDDINDRIKELEDRIREVNEKYDSLYDEEETVSDEDTDGIGDYEMTASDEIDQFMSGKTLEDIFGEAPEGEQNYLVQKLSDMLQDGKNMINAAMNKWGNDIAEYGKPLFQYIQQMSNDKQLTNKKAVLLATFLGELKEFQLRNPDRSQEVRALHNAVESYYQNYMNVRGKEVVAGRLLRLYRDKYIGDVFAEQILEEKEAKAKRIIKEAEDNKSVKDEAIYELPASISEEQKKQEDNNDKSELEQDQKKKEKKKKMSTSDAQKLAEGKLNDLKAKVGEGNVTKNMADRINDLINRINCR